MNLKKTKQHWNSGQHITDMLSACWTNSRYSHIIGRIQNTVKHSDKWHFSNWNTMNFIIAFRGTPASALYIHIYIYTYIYYIHMNEFTQHIFQSGQDICLNHDVLTRGGVGWLGWRVVQQQLWHLCCVNTHGISVVHIKIAGIYGCSSH